MALFHRSFRHLSRANGSRDREHAQIGRDQPELGLSQFVLAGALALAGLLAEAAEVCAVAGRLAPDFTIAKYRAEAISDNPVYLAQREYFDKGLRLAGVPEG